MPKDQPKSSRYALYSGEKMKALLAGPVERQYILKV